MPISCNSTTANVALLSIIGIISLILGALSWTNTDIIHLPLPTWIPATTTLLAPLTPLLLFGLRTFLDRSAASRSQAINATNLIQIISHIHTILLSALATLALAYLYPENTLSCHMEKQWQSYFSQKNSGAIRSIQDRYQCCGFRSIHDRAWPFKDHTNKDNACELRYGYSRPCIQQWAGAQRNTSWMIFVAVVGGLVVKILFAQLSTRRVSWIDKQFSGNRQDQQRILGPELEDGNDHADNEGEARRAMLPQSRPGQENVWDVD